MATFWTLGGLVSFLSGLDYESVHYVKHTRTSYDVMAINYYDFHYLIV